MAEKSSKERVDLESTVWTEEVAGTKEERGRERNQDKREREIRILYQSNVSTVPRNQGMGNQGIRNQEIGTQEIKK